MNEYVALVTALLAGLCLGAMFFGGLWWTVRKAFLSKQPALWFFGSLLLRTSAALGGFYLVGCGHWERSVTCLLGFVIARFVVTLITRPSVEYHPSAAEEISHAP